MLATLFLSCNHIVIIGNKVKIEFSNCIKLFFIDFLWVRVIKKVAGHAGDSFSPLFQPHKRNMERKNRYMELQSIPKEHKVC
jgi:hypothetical protein